MTRTIVILDTYAPYAAQTQLPGGKLLLSWSVFGGYKVATTFPELSHIGRIQPNSVRWSLGAIAQTPPATREARQATSTT